MALPSKYPQGSPPMRPDPARCPRPAKAADGTPARAEARRDGTRWRIDGDRPSRRYQGDLTPMVWSCGKYSTERFKAALSIGMKERTWGPMGERWNRIEMQRGGFQFFRRTRLCRRPPVGSTGPVTT